MKVERFLYTSKPGKGFAGYSSSKLMPERLKDSIRQPLPASNNRGFEAGLGVTRWGSETDRRMVCTYLEGDRDEYSRPFVLSHSALLSTNDYQNLAPHFDVSILAPLRDGASNYINDIDENEGIKPLESNNADGQEIRQEELDLLNQFTDKDDDLERLLVCLFAEKGFVLRIRETQDTAISLAVVMLKLAAIEGTVAPSIATFTPVDRKLYLSRVLPDAGLRTPYEFLPSGKVTDKYAETIADVVKIAIQDGDFKSIRQAFDSAKNSAANSDQVEKKAAEEQLNPRQRQHRGKPSRTSVVPKSGAAIEAPRETWDDKYREDLNERKRQLDEERAELGERGKRLDERGKRLDEREKDLKGKADELTRDQRHFDKTRTKVALWKALSDADEILQREEGGKGFQDDIVGLIKGRVVEWVRDIKGRNKEKAENAARVEENQKLMGFFIKLASEHPTLGKEISTLKDEAKKRKRQ